MPTAAATMPYAHLPQPIQAAFPPAMTHIPPRPAYYPPIIYWYPSPPVSPQTYYTHTGPSVLLVRGLPFNVTVQDIMNFFQGFPEVCFTHFLQKCSRSPKHFFASFGLFAMKSICLLKEIKNKTRYLKITLFLSLQQNVVIHWTIGYVEGSIGTAEHVQFIVASKI